MSDATTNITSQDNIGRTISDFLLTEGVVSSLVVVMVLISLRFVLVHFIKRKAEILDKDQRRWINRINNSASILIVFFLTLIWAPQLQTFALSLTAVAVAIVLTTKELLMCLTGGFLRASSNIFNIGDWIKVDGIMGEVMKISATTTLIEKVDTETGSYDFTGETIQIPNSRFLTANIENANFIKKYIYHHVNIAIQFSDVDAQHLLNKFREIATKAFTPYQEDALKFNRRVEKKAALDFADPDPQFSLKTTDLGHYRFSVRMFIPTKQAAQIELHITEEFLAFIHAERQKSKEEENALHPSTSQS